MKKILNIMVSDQEFDQLMIEQSNGKELKVVNNKVVAINHELTQEELKKNEISQIKKQLQKYTEDFIQESIGAVIPNIETKKIEFINLHNRLRTLEGKEARVYIKKV